MDKYFNSISLSPLPSSEDLFRLLTVLVCHIKVYFKIVLGSVKHGVCSFVVVYLFQLCQYVEPSCSIFENFVHYGSCFQFFKIFVSLQSVHLCFVVLIINFI
jgi:hypothetical protein